MAVNRQIVLLIIISSFTNTSLFCRALECFKNQWRCDGSKCIPKNFVCNGQVDCLDGTDEMMHNCHISFEQKCHWMQFKCGNGMCIPVFWTCDGHNDCGDPDASDESHCKKICEDGEFQCRSDLQCISAEWRCNGVTDCLDGSDEECDGSSSSPLVICHEHEFECESYCITDAMVCDWIDHCLNGEDEANCTECRPDQFQCANKQQCIPTAQYCDMTINCEDESDEINCTTEASQSPFEGHCRNLTSHFQCQQGRCIQRSSLCDGKDDCGDLEDENDTNCRYNDCARNSDTCKRRCDHGYQLNENNICEDVDECTENVGTCSQLCNNTDGGYYCSCMKGYEQVPGDYSRCKAASGSPYLLFSRWNDICKLRVKDRQLISIVSNVRGVTAIDYMYKGQQIVWTNSMDNEIIRTSLKIPGENEIILKRKDMIPYGLAVDWIHGHLYFTDIKHFKIHMMSWDTKWTKTIADEDLYDPRAITVSPLDGYIFWINRKSPPTIERAELDGSDRTVIITYPHDGWGPGITVDHTRGHIYWCDISLDNIYRANLDGTQMEVVFALKSPLQLPSSIDVFEDHLYWIDFSHKAIFSTNKFTGEDLKRYYAGYELQKPFDVHVYHEYRQPPGENVCILHMCSHMCLRSPNGTAICVCPDGLVFSSTDSMTCLINDTTIAASTLTPVTTEDYGLPSAITPTYSNNVTLPSDVDQTVTKYGYSSTNIPPYNETSTTPSIPSTITSVHDRKDMLPSNINQTATEHDHSSTVFPLFNETDSVSSLSSTIIPAHGRNEMLPSDANQTTDENGHYSTVPPPDDETSLTPSLSSTSTPGHGRKDNIHSEGGQTTTENGHSSTVLPPDNEMGVTSSLPSTVTPEHGRDHIIPSDTNQTTTENDHSSTVLPLDNETRVTPSPLPTITPTHGRNDMLSSDTEQPTTERSHYSAIITFYSETSVTESIPSTSTHDNGRNDDIASEADPSTSEHSLSSTVHPTDNDSGVTSSLLSTNIPVHSRNYMTPSNVDQTATENGQSSTVISSDNEADVIPTEASPVTSNKNILPSDVIATTSRTALDPYEISSVTSKNTLPSEFRPTSSKNDSLLNEISLNNTATDAEGNILKSPVLTVTMAFNVALGLFSLFVLGSIILIIWWKKNRRVQKHNDLRVPMLFYKNSTSKEADEEGLIVAEKEIAPTDPHI